MGDNHTFRMILSMIYPPGLLIRQMDHMLCHQMILYKGSSFLLYNIWNIGICNINANINIFNFDCVIVEYNIEKSGI